MKNTPGFERERLSRRDFAGSAVGAGALLALAPPLDAAISRHREMRTLFFNLSYENYAGHTYYLVIGRHRYALSPVYAAHPALAKARRTNSVLAKLPDSAITHVVENILVPNAVHLAYTIKDPDTSTGTWGMSSIYLIPPKSSFVHAYNAIRKELRFASQLPLSAKRKKYGLLPALSLQDLLDEQDLLDTTDWATAMVNLHPEMLSAEPNSAAFIQANYIQGKPATFQLSEILGSQGTATRQESPGHDNSQGWATLVPYTDDDDVTPLKNTTGNNKGLILYDAKWQPATVAPFIAAAMKPALRSVKDDTSLGADITAGRANLRSNDLTGMLWYRNDGVASVGQSSEAPSPPDNVKYTLTNVTPNYNGYSLAAAVTPDNRVTLNFTNWYLRWLGVYIQFYKDDNTGETPIEATQIPNVSQLPGLDQKYAIFLGVLTPEFTIYGIPISDSKLSVTFPFPTGIAQRAVILASGLGAGSHTFPETEDIGIVNTVIFNMIAPALLLGLGLGASVDLFSKQVVLPALLINGFLVEFFALFSGATKDQLGTIFWRIFVRGIVKPAVTAFLNLMKAFFTEQEVVDAIEDAIPIVGAILQALGAAGTAAEVAETTVETGLSPWTYQYSLIGRYDLSLTINHDPEDPNGFPTVAATYTVTAIFDDGTPHTQTLSLQNSNNPKAPITVTFPGVPLGGMVTLTVGFYEPNGTQVGHGTTGPIPNMPPSGGASGPAITITQLPVPLLSCTAYKHNQKTALNGQNEHYWVPGLPPEVPSSPSACGPNPGNICQFRNITYNSSMGYIGYGWQSYSNSDCDSGASGQLDQMANIPGVNDASGNAQSGYAAMPCALDGPATLMYDPLGRASMNYYLDTSSQLNVLRQVQLNPPKFSDPRDHRAWGIFNLPPDDLLLHPAGVVITINTALSRMESLKLPTAPVSDAEAAISLLANLHAGQGKRPGLLNGPTAATITSDGVILVLEAGNNRIHAVDAFGNPIRHFSNQPEPYFLELSATGGADTQYLDIAVEFSGFIYVLSSSNSVYRLDIYKPDQTGTDPFCKVMGVNAAKVTVDYWRNVYSLNYEVLMVNNALPPGGITEPSISQWIPETPPSCQSVAWSSRPRRRGIAKQRLLRRRDIWRAYLPS
ncbi:MAG TPA: hypothetical protein VH369_25485 [Bryobacteraceae bacterium]